MFRLTALNHQLNPLSTSEYKLIEVEILGEEQVAIVYMNSKSDLNILKKALRTELISAFTKLEEDPNVKVVVLLSKVERAFSAGAQVKEFLTNTHESEVFQFQFGDFTQFFFAFKKPVVVGINGLAFGGGFEFAMYLDVLICSEDAKFGLPELKVGVMPGIGGTQLLSKLVGKTSAMRYILTGDTINAQQALRMGIVSDVVKREQLKDECLKVAKSIAEKPMTNLILAKECIRKSEELGLTQGIQYEKAVFRSLFNTKAPKVGVNAFLEKRVPEFKKI